MKQLVITVACYFTERHKRAVNLLINNMLGTRILEKGLTEEGDDYYLIEVSRDELVEIFQDLDYSDVLTLKED